MSNNGYVAPSFHIIRTRNNLNIAETVNGNRVRREEKIFFSQYNRSVACAPYDNHFVFEDNLQMGWTLFCTCGAPAGIVGFQAYKEDASPTSKEEDTIAGEMIVCMHHAKFNRHLDGSS